MSEKPPRLLDLVIAKLQEEFPYPVTSVYRSAYMAHDEDHESEIFDIYVNNTFIGEVHPQKMAVWTPRRDGEPINPKVYDAHDPEFFTHIINTARLIIKQQAQMIEDGLRNAQYFNL